MDNMDNVKQTIMDKLYETKTHYEVKIPLAIESGSRGWGFAATNADYDCRFVYLHKPDWYLSVFKKKDFIEYATDGIFDIKGYDITRALTDITNSRATIYEYLCSNEVYIQDGYAVDRLRNLAKIFFNPIPVSYHYLGLARNTLSEIIDTDEAKVKKYFYVLRPIANLNFIWQYRKMPYMEYDKTLLETNPGQEIFSAIQELKELKITLREHDKIPQNKFLITYFKAEIERFNDCLKGMKHTKSSDYDLVDETFRDIIKAAWK